MVDRANDLMLALRSALAATAETDPRELTGEDLSLWHLCDQRCCEIIEALIDRHDEAGPAMRQLLARFTLRGYSGEPRSSNA